MLKIRAVAYQIVNRPRILSMSRAHDVTHAAHRVNQLRFAGMIDLLTQARDHDVYDVCSRIEVIVPGVLGAECSCHDAALMPHDILENSAFTRGPLHVLAGARDF